MASFRKRGHSWTASVFKHRVRDTATFSTKAEASAWAIKREAEIVAGIRGDIVPHTLKQALERYAADVSPRKGGSRWEIIRLTKLTRELDFAGRLLSDVQPSDIAAWRDNTLIGTSDRKPLKPASIRREMVLMRSVLERCRKEWGWLAKNPMDGVEWPASGRARERRVSDDELERILLALNYERGSPPKTISQRIAVAFLWALETGMRAGEIVAMRWSQVEEAARYVELPTTKNGDARHVPLSRAVLSLLELLRRERRDVTDTVFNVSSRSLDALFRKARDRCQIVDLHFHDTRHEATTRLAQRLDVLDLARMLGHRDLKSLRVYYNPTASEIAARLDRTVD